MYISNIKWKKLWKEFDEIFTENQNTSPLTPEQSRDLIEQLVEAYEGDSHKQWCTGVCPCEQKASQES